MQDLNDIQKTKLERLNLRLAEIEAERESIRTEMQTLSSSLRQDVRSGRWSQTVVAAVSVVGVASLLFIGFFHDAQSKVKHNDRPDASVIHAQETVQVIQTDHESAISNTPQAKPVKRKTGYARTKAASHRQWGPLLVMSEPDASKRYYGFDPVVKAQQEDLLTLGFDLGEADGFKGLRTRQAIAEFRSLYLPDGGKQLRDADLAVLMEAYANLARSDAARFGIDHGVVAAIRLSSVRTGVDFSYLMKLAATESNFEPASEAATSSATGLYQFTHDTWLNALKAHGAKYGVVADYAAHIEYYETWSGYQRPILRDKAMYEHLLALRKNPRVSAMMAAETVRDNHQKLVSTLGREPTETDLYLTHFLGPDDAITFLLSLAQSPDTHAVELFPEAASSNHRIFHPETCAPRTVDEVYTLFGEKLSRRRYEQPDIPELDDRSAGLQPPQTSAALKKPATANEWERGRAL